MQGRMHRKYRETAMQHLASADVLVYNMKSSCFINNADMSTRRYMSAARIASTTTHTLFLRHCFHSATHAIRRLCGLARTTTHFLAQM
jgi:hypothetical protein